MKDFKKPKSIKDFKDSIVREPGKFYVGDKVSWVQRIEWTHKTLQGTIIETNEHTSLIERYGKNYRTYTNSLKLIKT